MDMTFDLNTQVNNKRNTDGKSALLRALYRSDNAEIRMRVDASCERFLNGTDALDDNAISDICAKFERFDMPSEGVSPEAYLTSIESDVLPHCSHLASPRYLGHMTAPIPQFLPEIGRLIQTLNQNVVKMETSRGLTFLERQVIGMFHREIYRQSDAFYQRYLQTISSTLGIFTSGGTLANVCAVWTAWRRAQMDTSAEESSRMVGKNVPVIIGSELMHYSFDKAAELLGVQLYKVPVDNQYQIDLSAAEQAISGFLSEGRRIICVVAVAGSTDYGSVDPLRELNELAVRADAHFHVDAAWGGGLVLSESNRHLLDGIELADTVTIDGHKQLMLPIGCGILFFRDPGLSEVTMHHAPYAVRPTSFDQGRFTLEGTRPATALYLHAAMHVIGKSGYDTLFSDSLARARYMAQAIQSRPEFELIVAPTMNLLAYRYLPEKYRNCKLTADDNDQISAFNIALQKMQRQKGDSFVSRTFRSVPQYQGQPLTLLRAVLLNPLSTFADIDFLLDDQVVIAQQIAEKE